MCDTTCFRFQVQIDTVLLFEQQLWLEVFYRTAKALLQNSSLYMEASVAL